MYDLFTITLARIQLLYVAPGKIFPVFNPSRIVAISGVELLTKVGISGDNPTHAEAVNISCFAGKGLTISSNICLTGNLL